jgi:hypothetical protein
MAAESDATPAPSAAPATPKPEGDKPAQVPPAPKPDPAPTGQAAGVAHSATTAAADEKAVKLTTAQLDERLERERMKVLRALGVETEEDAKAALADLQKRQDAEKTELQRLQEQVAALQGVTTERDALLTVVGQRAANELATLSDEQREAVQALAGDDPHKQLHAIETLRKTWAKPPGGNGEPVPAPATTTPTSPAPTAPTASAEDHLGEWERLQSNDPFGAAHYYLSNQAVIEQQRKARA